MNRNIISNADAAKDPQGHATEDSNLQRLLKYIPAETIGGYVASEGLLKSLVGSDSGRRLALLLLFLSLAAFNLVYLSRIARVTRLMQIVISELAFAVYVFAVGGFWTSFAWWKAGWGSLAVIGFALLAVFAKPSTVAPPAPVAADALPPHLPAPAPAPAASAAL